MRSGGPFTRAYLVKGSAHFVRRTYMNRHQRPGEADACLIRPVLHGANACNGKSD